MIDQLDVIATLLGLILALGIYIWKNSQKKIDQLITSQGMFIEQIAEMNNKIAVIMEKIESHERRLGNLE